MTFWRFGQVEGDSDDFLSSRVPLSVSYQCPRVQSCRRQSQVEVGRRTARHVGGSVGSMMKVGPVISSALSGKIHPVMSGNRSYF